MRERYDERGRQRGVEERGRKEEVLLEHLRTRIVVDGWLLAILYSCQLERRVEDEREARNHGMVGREGSIGLNL